VTWKHWRGYHDRHDEAAVRVDATPELEKYRDLILDYPRDDAHFTWAATCDLDELLT
jgi:hypothetical protein